ncbi:MAG: hypothetical protein SGJ02_01710, partial [bacterium]|nr:hypothetical protein [bacterium]
FSALISLLLVAIYLFLPPTAFAQTKIAPSHKAKGDDFDSYKATITSTVAVEEKNIRIKRDKILSIKALPLNKFMERVALDGRINKFNEMLRWVYENKPDSCSSCWSVFNKFVTASSTASKKYSKENPNKKDKKKNKGKLKDKKEDEPIVQAKVVDLIKPKGREPSLSVLDASSELFYGLASSKEADQIYEAIKVLSKKLKEKSEKTPGERDYFDMLSYNMQLPFKK